MAMAETPAAVLTTSSGPARMCFSVHVVVVALARPRATRSAAAVFAVQRRGVVAAVALVVVRADAMTVARPTTVPAAGGAAVVVAVVCGRVGAVEALRRLRLVCVSRMPTRLLAHFHAAPAVFCGVPIAEGAAIQGHNAYRHYVVLVEMVF